MQGIRGSWWRVSGEGVGGKQVLTGEAADNEGAGTEEG